MVGRVAVEEDAQRGHALVAQLGGDRGLGRLDLIESLQAVVVDVLRVLVEVGVGCRMAWR